jgi:hypothetical protein
MSGSSLKTKEWGWIAFLVVAFVDEKDKKKECLTTLLFLLFEWLCKL